MFEFDAAMLARLSDQGKTVLAGPALASNTEREQTRDKEGKL